MIKTEGIRLLAQNENGAGLRVAEAGSTSGMNDGERSRQYGACQRRQLPVRHRLCLDEAKGARYVSL